MTREILAAVCLLSCAAGSMQAEEAEIVGADMRKMGMDWRVSVTIRHPDTGWDHYADGWEVLDAAGHRLGFRELLHPHVNEQPFTRSLGRVYIPDGTSSVFIRSRCSEHGWGSDLHEVAVVR